MFSGGNKDTSGMKWINWWQHPDCNEVDKYLFKVNDKGCCSTYIKRSEHVKNVSLSYVRSICFLCPGGSVLIIDFDQIFSDGKENVH